MTRGTLIIFVKAPKAGRVKTRLGREIGFGRAAEIFRKLTALTVAEAMSAHRTGVGVVIAVDPPGEIRHWRRLWPGELRRAPQSRGSLGDRLVAAISEVERGPVVVIGADAPGFRARHVRAAFKALGAHDAVFGPAPDGGFWLVGLARRRRAHALFEGVRWSTRHALRDAQKSLPTSFRVASLVSLGDIDEAGDLGAPILRSPARALTAE